MSTEEEKTKEDEGREKRTAFFERFRRFFRKRRRNARGVAPGPLELSLRERERNGNTGSPRLRRGNVANGREILLDHSIKVQLC